MLAGADAAGASQQELGGAVGHPPFSPFLLGSLLATFRPFLGL
jgi:hypothetical protein